MLGYLRESKGSLGQPRLRKSRNKGMSWDLPAESVDHPSRGSQLPWPSPTLLGPKARTPGEESLVGLAWAPPRTTGRVNGGRVAVDRYGDGPPQEDVF